MIVVHQRHCADPWRWRSARRAIPGHVRPTFQEMEKTLQRAVPRPQPPLRNGAVSGQSSPSSSSRRKAAHGGHHGGAWKVAYADFVTAMMALFIVLWLMNSSKQVQEAVGGYFKDPTGNVEDGGQRHAAARGRTSRCRKEDMTKLKEELQKAIRHAATSTS